MFRCNLPPAWQNVRGLLRATVVTGGQFRSVHKCGDFVDGAVL